MVCLFKILSLIAVLFSGFAQAEDIAATCNQLLAGKGMVNFGTISYCQGLSQGGSGSLSSFSFTENECVDFAQRQGVSKSQATIFCQGGLDTRALFEPTDSSGGDNSVNLGSEANQFLNPNTGLGESNLTNALYYSNTASLRLLGFDSVSETLFSAPTALGSSAGDLVPRVGGFESPGGFETVKDLGGTSNVFEDTRTPNLPF